MDAQRKEALLQQEVEKCRRLVQEVNSIILKLDTQGNITFANNFTLKYFGYTLDEIQGRNVSAPLSRKAAAQETI